MKFAKHYIFMICKTLYFYDLPQTSALFTAIKYWKTEDFLGKNLETDR
jgi:hypothetical protein